MFEVWLRWGWFKNSNVAYYFSFLYFQMAFFLLFSFNFTVVIIWHSFQQPFSSHSKFTIFCKNSARRLKSYDFLGLKPAKTLLGWVLPMRSNYYKRKNLHCLIRIQVGNNQFLEFRKIRKVLRISFKMLMRQPISFKLELGMNLKPNWVFFQKSLWKLFSLTTRDRALGIGWPLVVLAIFSGIIWHWFSLGIILWENTFY